MANLTFDPEKHVYCLDGQQVPSVTQILRTLGIIDTRWATEHALERGTAVHQAIQFLVEDDLDWSTVTPEIAPYLDAFWQFAGDVELQVNDTEMIVYSPTHRYAGRLDLLATVQGERAIIEIKTGKALDWVNLQLAAYAMCYDGVLPARFCLELRANGTYRLTEHRKPTDLSEWMSCLAVYQIRKRTGTLNGGNNGNGVEE